MSLDKNRKIHIVDTTLRDGSHAVSHSYTVDQVTAIASGLDKVGVDIIELSHGDGLAGSSINYGFSKVPEMELLKAASRVVKNAKLGPAPTAPRWSGWPPTSPRPISPSST